MDGEATTFPGKKAKFQFLFLVRLSLHLHTGMCFCFGRRAKQARHNRGIKMENCDICMSTKIKVRAQYINLNVSASNVIALVRNEYIVVGKRTK